METRTLHRPIEILLVEDSPADVRLTMETLKDGKISNHMNVVWDGVEALQYLRQLAHFRNAVRPDLILLDLNLPKLDGRDVLREIKADENLQTIPVIILTTSDSEQDIVAGYNQHANCYIVKPVKLDQFVEVVKSIEDFWLSIVRLPMI
ncbi:response regulator [bacterium]|nr:response regulator [bacterium]MBU1983314.1 response regulator [bacterium]